MQKRETIIKNVPKPKLEKKKSLKFQIFSKKFQEYREPLVSICWTQAPQRQGALGVPIMFLAKNYFSAMISLKLWHDFNGINMLQLSLKTMTLKVAFPRALISKFSGKYGHFPRLFPPCHSKLCFTIPATKRVFS